MAVANQQNSSQSQLNALFNSHRFTPSTQGMYRLRAHINPAESSVIIIITFFITLISVFLFMIDVCLCLSVRMYVYLPFYTLHLHFYTLGLAQIALDPAPFKQT